LVDSLSYWTFTDVFEENRNGDTVFHDGLGLINYQEIVKPAFHAYRFMNELGDEMLNQETGGIVSRDNETGRVTVVAYNYPPEMKVSLPVTNTPAAANAIDANGSVRELTLDLDHVPAGARLRWRCWIGNIMMGAGLGSDGTTGAADARADS